jgi:photosystem II stability/assembly factor-like uncharacterized protein
LKSFALLIFLILALSRTTLAQQTEASHTSESLRGVSAVSRQIAWASGTHGTYLRTIDAGRTWIPSQVPDAATLDFRAVVGFSADEAFLMSAGPGDQSRIYHTSDAGQHWQLQFTNTNPKGFFDSMAFWDAKHGIVLGDPVPDTSGKEGSGKDESGKLHFELLLTADGQTWRPIASSQMPEAIDGEGAFAASNSCIAILPSRDPLPSRADLPSTATPPLIGTLPSTYLATRPSKTIFSSSLLPITTPPSITTWKSGASAPRNPPQKDGALAPEGDPNIWFATGGNAARVFHSPDRGQTWQVSNTPIFHGPESAGIFSIAFRDAMHGVIAGGDYKLPNQDGPNLAFTEDGGKTWTLSPLRPLAYFSAVTYDRKVNEQAQRDNSTQLKTKIFSRPITPERLFIVGQDFVFDFRPPANPRRISPKKNSGIKFNAISPYPDGGAVVVGAKGAIVTIP